MVKEATYCNLSVSESTLHVFQAVLSSAKKLIYLIKLDERSTMLGLISSSDVPWGILEGIL